MNHIDIRERDYGGLAVGDDGIDCCAEEIADRCVYATCACHGCVDSYKKDVSWVVYKVSCWFKLNR